MCGVSECHTLRAPSYGPQTHVIFRHNLVTSPELGENPLQDSTLLVVDFLPLRRGLRLSNIECHFVTFSSKNI